jgi:hypothetical protein
MSHRRGAWHFTGACDGQLPVPGKRPIIRARTSRLPEIARCGKELNNSSWKKIQDGCPSAAAASIEQSGSPRTMTELDSKRPPGHDNEALERVNANPL